MQGEGIEFYGQPHSNVNDFNKKAMIAIFCQHDWKLQEFSEILEKIAM
jgi:hypothetical protein